MVRVIAITASELFFGSQSLGESKSVSSNSECLAAKIGRQKEGVYLLRQAYIVLSSSRVMASSSSRISSSVGKVLVRHPGRDWREEGGKAQKKYYFVFCCSVLSSADPTIYQRKGPQQLT